MLRSLGDSFVFAGWNKGGEQKRFVSSQPGCSGWAGPPVHLHAAEVLGTYLCHCSAVKQPSVSSSTTTAALQVSHGNQEASLHGKGLQHKAMQNTGLKSWTWCLGLLGAVRCEPDAERMKTHHRRSQARWEVVIYSDLSPSCVKPSGAVNPCDGWYDAGCNWRDSQEPGCKGESKLQLGTSS